MKLKWRHKKFVGIKDVKHGMCGVQFISPIKKAKEVNEWSWWGLFLVIVLMGIAFLLKISGKI